MDNEKATRGLIFTPELAEALPNLPEAFEQVNQAQNTDREAYLNEIIGSVFSFRHRLGRVTCAALWNHAGDNPTEALVTLPPFTDCAPRSSGKRLADYSTKEEAGLLDIIKAAPNSARQIIKLATSNELEHTLGAGKVAVAFFSDTPMRAYSLRQRAEILGGGFGSMTEIVEHGLAEVQDRLHGPKSETQISDIHLAGASQGASQAVAVGSHLTNEGSEYRVKTVTTQELIMGPKNYRQLLKGLGGHIGEVSTIDVAEQEHIPETTLLHNIDRHGNEPAMFGRMLKASVLKPFNMAGLTKPMQTYLHIDNLDARNVPVTILLAAQSGLTQETATYLQNCSNNVGLVTVRAVAGQFADHLADENVDVVATGIALGSRR
jgi:hypothetical protein